jgi:hypothetical protein
MAMLFVAAVGSLGAVSQGATVRAVVIVRFAAPACFTACHAVMGPTAIAPPSEVWRTTRALFSALVVAAAAGREVTRSKDQRVTG